MGQIIENMESCLMWRRASPGRHPARKKVIQRGVFCSNWLGGMKASIDVNICLILADVTEFKANFVVDISFTFSNTFAQTIFFVTLRIFLIMRFLVVIKIILDRNTFPHVLHTKVWTFLWRFRVILSKKSFHFELWSIFVSSVLALGGVRPLC